MHFAKTLLVCASLVASAVSQSKIAFTVLPSSIQAGQDVTLHWGGGDNSPVTLTLQQGTATDLKTILLVKGDATGTSYTWSVPTTLPYGTNYALRIQQAETENYTGMFTITGGPTSTASSASSSVSHASSSQSSVSSSSNATATANSTITSSALTAAKSAGTGTSIARNTTLSKASLSATSAAATSSNPSVGGSGGSPTESTSAPAASKTGGAIALVASNFALLVCAVAGIMFLG